jgi:membrane dipeptidase
MEKEPLLGGGLPREAAPPKSRRLLTAIRVLAITSAASFAACYAYTGYWPLDYVVYSPAERVLVRNPLIGMHILFPPLTIAFYSIRCVYFSKPID